MFYVYVLQSLIYRDEFYTGSTNNLRVRFKMHNDGKVYSTKRYRPWKLIYYEAYETEKLARAREQKLKHNGNAMKELKKRIIDAMDIKNNKSLYRIKNGAGFTLIELLVVISIIAVLAGVLIASLTSVRQRGRDAQRKTDLSQIRSALELYRSDQGYYPTALPACGNPLTSGINGSGGSITYLAKMPCDPLNTSTPYSYSANPSSTCDDSTTFCNTYCINSCLENGNDSQANNDTCGSYSCSPGVRYVVKSP